MTISLEVNGQAARSVFCLPTSFVGLLVLGCTPIAPTRSTPQPPQTSLHQVIFKRTDRTGQLLWKVQAAKVKVTDLRVVHLNQIQGTFYHDREPIYSLQAPHGQVHQHSHFIQLQGPIVVRHLRDRTTLRSQRIQWHPQSGQLIAQAGVRLQHPHFELQGQRFQASTQTHQVHLSGSTTVKWPDRNLQLQAQDINWLPHQDQLQAYSAMPAKVTLRPTSKSPQNSMAWQQVQAQRIDLHVQARQLIFDQSVAINFSDSRMQIKSPKVVVDLAEQRWQTPQGMYVHYQGITAKANQGWFTPSRTLHLQNQVHLQGLPQQAQLRAQALTWNMATQDLKANGNLVYQQPQPWIRMTGTSAVGNLRQQTLEVEGGEAIAEIVP